MLARLELGLARERRFVADASHELRTPLANLRAELELALRRSRTNEQLTDALRSAMEEAERLSLLAEDLLVLARAADGRLPVQRQPTEVTALVEEEVGRFAGRAASVGRTLTMHPAEPQHASVDPARLRQAIANLIDNALRHAPRGGRVDVTVSRADAAIEVEVADDGEGLTPDFLARLAEPFSRQDASRTRNAGGAGLGLAIVRAVVNAHGGQLRAANRPEGGARITIALPA
jgi:signal transduction histidine kinase